MSAVDFRNPLLDEGDAALHADTQLGAALKAAKDTPLYQFLVLRLNEAADQALANFLTCDPSEVEKVAKAQAWIRLSREIPRWIDEKIAQGVQAQAALADRFGDDLPRYVPEDVVDG